MSTGTAAADADADAAIARAGMAVCFATLVMTARPIAGHATAAQPQASNPAQRSEVAQPVGGQALAHQGHRFQPEQHAVLIFPPSQLQLQCSQQSSMAGA